MAQEVSNICSIFGLPDACREEVTKDEVEKAIMYHHLKELKLEMEPQPNKPKKKLQDLRCQDLRQRQPYMEKPLADCRIAFGLQTMMIECRTNMKRRYGGDLGCQSCSPNSDSPAETIEHMKICPAYESEEKSRYKLL